MISFGPVPSRRLGRSIGINNIPMKNCTYSCVYCQVGSKCNLITDRKEFYPTEIIIRDVEERISAAGVNGETVDYLTYVADGEPTLDINLGAELQQLAKYGIKRAVISNSSLINDDKVKQELSYADFVSLKVDSVEENLWRKINRPHKDLALEKILTGIKDFRCFYKGIFATETMIIKGFNDNQESLNKIVEYLHQLNPDTVYLSFPIRPPALRTIEIPSKKSIELIMRIFNDSGLQFIPMFEHENNDFVSTKDPEEDLLSILKVHPMNHNAMLQYLSKSGRSFNLVDKMVSRGEIEVRRYNDEIFYRFKKDKFVGS